MTSPAHQIHYTIKILNYTPCANDEEFDRTVSFFNGLFIVMKIGAITLRKAYGHISTTRGGRYSSGETGEAVIGIARNFFFSILLPDW